MDWTPDLDALKKAMEAASQAKAELEKWENESAATIAKYARASGANQLDPEAIKASVTRPYTLLPINEHEAWLIHWRGIKMPIFGWVVSQEPAFLKARVTRSMDLLTPIPQWMRDELGWKAPAHAAIIDGTRTNIQITEGEEETFLKKYGRFLGRRQSKDSFKIKGGDAWIKLVASLVRDGILPYSPTPVARENWIENAPITPALTEIIKRKEKDANAPYIYTAVAEFVQKGAVLVNYPPGSGKTLITCAILNKFKGRVLLLADSTMLIAQWKERLALFCPKADVTLSTYQGAAKYLSQEWDLIIPDEAQRLPANTFSKLAFVKTKYRLGLTGTAWREDDRQHLIVALSGFPVALRWAELIASGVLRRPKISVVTVATENAKTVYVKTLLSKRKGRTLIFCDWIEQGHALADALDVPFIHGSTARKLERVQESEVCVVSRIGDRGISLPDLRMVIEVAGAGGAREQFAQRVGRLLHGQFEGEFVTIFTPQEAAKFRGRIFGVEAELAGEVDIEFIDQTQGKAREASTAHNGRIRRVKEVESEPKDEIGVILSAKPIQRLIIDHEKTMGKKSQGYMGKTLKILWNANGSSEDLRLREGKSAEGWKPYKASLKKLVEAGLAREVSGTYYLDRSRVNSLVKR